MKYQIRLDVNYDYAAAVSDARHILRVRPREDAGQSVETVKTTVEPRPDEIAPEHDFFDNRVDAVAFFSPHTALAVRMQATVTIDRPAPPLSETPSLAALTEAAAASRAVDAASPIHHLGASRRIADMPAIATYASAILGSRSRASGEAVLALNRQIHEDFAYAPGTTDVATTIEDAFAARRGVCQDFAQVMIAGLRACGVPARYVSGFLRTDPPEGQPRLEGADAMHAWVEAWLGERCGWVGFDPTNAVVAGNDHIVVALGRDYDDAQPIAGAFITAGGQRTRHRADVMPID
ncbi:transglutaminase family protein [Jiella sp. MQZ9-1]|uniref:Transglutaminase family protein n=1 Tax=Jiella flava TaxID=2816857 RepID=A0A939FV10_9HYPH|nr:transglutaminase family protein [Jiella flava]MCD2469950.1 transglutaminase family protein [Jiella flava]